MSAEEDGPPDGGGVAATWRALLLIVMALAGAGLLTALIVSQGAANRQRERALALQTHSYQVMILARTLSGSIARAEASLGRYVISGDKQLGQLYSDQWSQAGDQLDRLDEITDDNQEQQPRIDALREAYLARGRELSVTALSTAYHKNNQALARFYRAATSPSLTTINATLQQIIDGEHRVLDRRTATLMRTVTHAQDEARLFTVFGVLVALGAILLGWLTLRAQTERATARAEADAERGRAAALAEAVTAATDELRAQEAKLRQSQKMEAVGQLTGGIAHDFNNMLAVVIGGLELARRHVAGSAPLALRHLDSAAEGANRAAALTRRLLAFSRDEASQPEAIDPAALIAGMRDLLDRTLGDQVTIAVAERNLGWTVFADRGALENAVLNLAVNARDAMDGRGALRIETGAATLAAGQVGECAAGEHVTVAVSDSGCGMSTEVIERVFEPFFTTKPVGKGTGLGLSQIFALVRQLGGAIAIDSAPGAGATVTLYLPRHRRGAAEASLVEVTAPAPPTPQGLAVLVVEDDPRVLAATLGAIEELGHRAIPCPDPLAAPALLAAEPGVALVISDVLMPGQTGPEMVAGLLRGRPDLAILFVTGYAGEAFAPDDLAGRSVLRKPFTLAGLERAIGETLATRPSAPETIAA